MTQQVCRRRLLLCLLGSVFLLNGCAAVALSVVGAGSSMAVSHSLNGIGYRTFTLPAQKVKVAALSALNRMGIKVLPEAKPDKLDKPDSEHVQVITARSNERDIEVQFESISQNVTRMRVKAKSDFFFYDKSTATEIIVQTERVLGKAASAALEVRRHGQVSAIS